MNAVRLIVGMFILSIGTLPAAGEAICQGESTIEPIVDGGVRHGRAVATDGSILVVGDYSADSNGGAIIISQWSGVAWTEQQVVYGVIPFGELGSSVAVANGVVLATALETADGDVDIFQLVLGAWTRTGSIVMPEGWQCAHRGLAMTATWAAIPLANSDTGFAAVGMWRLSGGVWVIEQIIELGQSSSIHIDMHDDQMVIGWFEADGDTVNEGLVEVYEVNEFDTWNSTADFPGGAANLLSGQIVSIFDDQIAFASGGWYVTGNQWPARVDVLNNSPGDGWVETWSNVVGDSYQFNDLDLGDGIIAAVIWDSDEHDGWQTVIADPATGMELSFNDPGGEGHGPRYVASVATGMVLYDVTLDDGSRQVRMRPANDCDQNGVKDACDNLLGNADLDASGELDRCECPGNINPHLDALVDADDIIGVFEYWDAETGGGDCDGDGVCGVLDLLIILENWGVCEA